jgi:hypothetical protein
MRFRSLLLSALCLVTSGAVAVAVAPVSYAADQHCQQAETYSQDRWQWGQTEICASYTPLGSNADRRMGEIRVVPDVSSLEYYWGGTWRYNQYPATITASVILMRDGHTVGDGKTVTFSTTGTSAIGPAVTLPVYYAGDYTVKAEISVDGGYWSEDSSSQVYAAPQEIELILAAP